MHFNILRWDFCSQGEYKICPTLHWKKHLEPKHQMFLIKTAKTLQFPA
jgi:hypothetical protein